MKKIILSFALIFVFGAYILHTRIIGANGPALTPTPSTTNTTPFSSPPTVSMGKYKDGNYTGDIVDAYYGNVQVSVTVSGGNISDVQFLDYPHDRQNSIRINSRAMPYLISEAITIQDSNVDTVSGASFTSNAYRESLASALTQAKI